MMWGWCAAASIPAGRAACFPRVPRSRARSSRFAGQVAAAGRRFGQPWSRSPKGWRLGRSPVAAAWKARIAGASTGSTSTSKRSWSAAARQGGRRDRGETGRPGAPRRRRAFRRADRRRRRAAPCDGPRDLRPRLRRRCRAAAGASDRGPALAHPGRADRARDGRHRAADPLPRERSAGSHAGRARPLPMLVDIACCRASQFALATTNESGMGLGLGAPGWGRSW